MSHPDPLYDPSEPVYKKKTAVAKSMERHRNKVGRSMRGMYPGSLADTWAEIRRKMPKRFRE
jgi:hypothetical protein